MLSPFSDERTSLRFKPEPLEYAQVQISNFDSDSSEFHADFTGFIVEEAPRTGCSLVVHNNEELFEGLRCNIKLGSLSPVLSEVVWIIELDEDLLRLGFKFVD